MTGRPPHQPTKANRDRVAIAAGGGMTHAAIAQALGISLPTLSLYYGFELSTGAHLKRMEVVQQLFRSAKKGSVTAGKAFLAHAPEFESTPEEKAEAAAATKPGKLGKKEQAQAEAVGAQVGTEWDDLLPPNVHPIRGAV